MSNSGTRPISTPGLVAKCYSGISGAEKVAAIKRFTRWAKEDLIPDVMSQEKGKHLRFLFTNRLQEFVRNAEWNSNRKEAIIRRDNYNRKWRRKGRGPQRASTISPIQKFFNSAGRLRQQMTKVELTKPITQWSVGELQTFLSCYRWLDEKIQQAKVLKGRQPLI